MDEHGPQVSLLAKDLPSYAYVRETWLDHGGLPDAPWLSERQRPFVDGSSRNGSSPRRLAGERHP
jgi:hypothetical protein